MKVTVSSAWQDGRALEVKVCCEDFVDATVGGSDNEGYGALIKAWDERWVLGSGLPPLKFCPWCGAALIAPPFELSPWNRDKEAADAS